MENIVIIKLGAQGDVLRTLPLANALKKKYPKSKITWITKREAVELIEGNKEVDRILTIPLSKEVDEKFDLLYNFDIEDEATSLAVKINAEKKFGFYSENGFLSAFNNRAEYYINTIFDDELKKKNRKTYQEMMFEVAETDYKKERFEIVLNEKDKKFGDEFVKENKINKEKLIGIHMGASKRWPSKVLHEEKLIELIELLYKRGYFVLLFGGPDEKERHEKFYNEMNNKNFKIFKNNVNNTKRELLALVNVCNIMICSDSLSLHVSIGLNKKTIGLFFCTSPDEVEGYGLLKKVVSKKLYEFFPERSDEYNEELVKSITAEEVLEAVEND